jgi:F420-dependent oxidoreductase-like protein
MTTPWFSFHLPNYAFPGTPPERLFDRIVEQARAAEAAGFAQVTVMDHMNQIPAVGPRTDPMLESWSVLSAHARETSRVRLGTQVSGVTYRNPALLAKAATTLDVISGGRAIIGMGAAYYEAEHRAFGFAFPPIGERMDRLDEALTVVKAMFTQERPSFTGRYYRIDEALNFPRPIQAGGPRIVVGGGGEQRTLKIAAKHADLTHWFPLGVETLRRKTDVLAGYCEAIGRDPATVERTMGAPVVVAATEAEARAAWELMAEERRVTTTPANPEQAADALRPYLDAGFTGFTFNNNVHGSLETIAALGKALRLLGG